MDKCKILKLDKMLFYIQTDNDKEILNELKKLEVNLSPFQFHNLMFHAIQKRWNKVFDTLCELYIAGKIDVDIDKDFSSGQNALSLCVIQNNIDYFKKLLLLGASPYKEVGLNLSKLPHSLKNLSLVRSGYTITPLSLMVDLSRLEMLDYIKKDADKKAFVREALRIQDKKEKANILGLLTENVTLQVKEMLFSAVKENQPELADSLLKLNKIRTIDFLNKEGKTPLILAIQNKSYDVVDVFKTLLEKKKIFFNVDFASNGTNPLNEALALNDERMIKKLLFMGASPTAGLGIYRMGKNNKEQEITPLLNELCNIVENKGKSFLNLFYLTSIYSQVDLVGKAVALAPFFGGKSVYRLLLKDKNDLSHEDIFTKKLIDSVQNDDIDMINFLIQKKVSPIDTFEGQSALHMAARQGKIEILNIFLNEISSKKIDTPLKGVTPFETAVWHNQEKAALALLKAGATVSTYLTSGDFLLSRIIDFDMGDVLRGCLLKNSKLKEDSVLKKALWQSVSLNRNKCVAALLETKVDVNFENVTKTPLIIQAVKRKNYQAARELLLKGADIKSVDSKGMGLLHCAILNREASFAFWLIDMGAHVDAQNKQGQTPLMLAMQNGLHKVAIGLIQARADAAIEDINGQKAIDYYRCFKNKKIILNKQNQMEKE